MLFSCNTADYDAILEQLRDHEERIQKLESLCNQLNSNIEAVQTILEALEQNDYITDITKITEAGIEIGYSITFAKGGTVNIYHGSNGSDAPAPKISIRKASDGEYYWTADDEWLTDENGNKIPATVPDDPDGQYITPHFRVAEGIWYISLDNGNTWQEAGVLDDDDTPAPLISDVTQDDANVYLTLADGSTIAIPKHDIYAEGCMMSPYIELGPINTANGVFGINYYGKQYYRTPRFMKVAGNRITIKALYDCEVKIHQYDDSFRFIKVIDWRQLPGNTAQDCSLTASCRYIRMIFRKNSSLEDMNKPHVLVGNVHKDEYYDIRPADDGYQRLVIPMNVSTPAASDDDSWEPQINSELMPDYGLLVLPETYSNIGKPTRLIIYCHGSGVNYPASVTRFPQSALLPEYWLNEGYAIMDIEGNPFDNSGAHCYIPQAREAYERAYKWVINTYNICQDGVFLGGRSMGGGMCFELLHSSIPVLAACPLVPIANSFWWWTYTSAKNKAFCTEKMGFTGTPPAWTSSRKLSDEEFNYLYDNYDKLVRYSPFLKGIVNLPDKDTMMELARMDGNIKYDEAEATLYSTLRYKAKAPVKIFGCHEDNVIPSRRNAELMYQMMKNSGQVCELRMFHTDAAAPHHFELQDSRYQTDVTTVYGETMKAPLVYVEMLEFWRRYEP